jgi:hypothetical protein
MSWIPLRQHLREHADRWLDDLIRHDPCRQLRAALAANREELTQHLVDQAEEMVEREYRDHRDLERAILAEAPCSTMQ